MTLLERLHPELVRRPKPEKEPELVPQWVKRAKGKRLPPKVYA